MPVFKSPDGELAFGKFEKARLPDTLVVSAYDRTASGLIALLWLVGAVTLCLFFMWLTHRSRDGSQPYKVAIYAEGHGRGAHRAGVALDSHSAGEPLDVPAAGELDEVLESKSLASTNLIDAAVATSLAEFGGRESGGGAGDEKGSGDRRPRGPLRDGLDVIPRWERWEIEFAAKNLSTYARQLDFFGIELGALGGQKEIDYVSNFSQSTPERRTGLPKDEHRLYMTWQTGTLQNFDRQLLRRAGVNPDRRLAVQFIPPPTEKLLEHLERTHLGARNIKEVSKTKLGVRVVGDSFEFYIVDQKFRTVLDRV